MSETKPKGVFYDGSTGQTTERELSDEEMSALPEPSESIIPDQLR